jgi:two-component system phosphate regulon response regulator PhoB
LLRRSDEHSPDVAVEFKEMVGMSMEPAKAERPLVVVIEDEEDLRELVAYNLRAEGFDALGAATAGEGLALCTMHCPHVVIIDRMLGDTDGIDLCAHLRADDRVAAAAIMVLTARGSEQDKRRGFEAGADDYVVKPFAVDALVERIRDLAFLASQRRALREPAVR